MRDYLEPMLGTTGALVAQFAITLLVLAVIILIVFWLIRTFTGGAGTAQVRGRQPRLSVLDALPVDQRRRLVLIRRDNVEHLILIGGPTDLVVEASIHRPSAAQRRAEAAARGNGQTPRYAPAAAPAERAPYEEARAEEPLPVEPPRQEFARQDYARAEPTRSERIRGEPVRQDAVRQEAVREESERFAPAQDIAHEAPAPEAPEAAPVPVEPVYQAEAAEESTYLAPPSRPDEAERAVAPEPAPPAAAPPSRSQRMSSFLGSVARGRSSSQDSAAEPAPEPRRVEPPTRPLGRATPVAPRAPEPAFEEAAEPAPRVEPVRAVEPVRPPVRPAMPPAPPVAPPTLGDEPFGAPTADADRAIRFEPIFDIDPTDASDPGRPVRPSREPHAAPSVEPPRLSDQPVTIDDRGETVVQAEEEPRQRGAAVGDLEKEMARLLGEISGTRRS